MMKEKQSVLRRNPVVRTGKWYLSLMKNKLIASLMLLGQGILFLVAPQGDMGGTVQTAGVVVILACVINIVLHMMQKEKGFISYLLIALNAVFILAGIYCLVTPQTIEPYVRVIIGAITAVAGLINLVETLRIENRKTWQFKVGLIAAMVMIGLGITMMIASKAHIELVQQTGGIFLVLSALINIWYMIRLKQASK